MKAEKRKERKVDELRVCGDDDVEVTALTNTHTHTQHERMKKRNSETDMRTATGWKRTHEISIISCYPSHNVYFNIG